MNYSLSVDIVNTLQNLFDKNSTSSLSQDKLIFNDSVEKLTASNATKSGLMIKGILTWGAAELLTILLQDTSHCGRCHKLRRAEECEDFSNNS